MTERFNAHNYYVDEAGDMTLFDKRGKVIVGRPGVSKVFMVGVAYLPQPELAREYLDGLRKELLADPYFKGVPSIQPEARKTATCFHACKDLAEIRYHVFKLLPRIKTEVFVSIRRKGIMAERISASKATSRSSRIEDIVYDDLVKRLFRDRLHLADENRIVFARKGKSARSQALGQAITRAKANFERAHGKPSDRPTRIISTFPREFAGLQVIDYYLWALQRLYERGEDRFFNLLSDSYKLIMDLDDRRNKNYGEYYSAPNPLTQQKILPVAG
jgi:hypothetical protein